jgi:hypothetical protein
LNKTEKPSAKIRRADVSVAKEIISNERVKMND